MDEFSRNRARSKQENRNSGKRLDDFSRICYKGLEVSKGWKFFNIFQYLIESCFFILFALYTEFLGLSVFVGPRWNCDGYVGGHKTKI